MLITHTDNCVITSQATVNLINHSRRQELNCLCQQEHIRGAGYTFAGQTSSIRCCPLVRFITEDFSLDRRVKFNTVLFHIIEFDSFNQRFIQKMEAVSVRRLLEILQFWQNFDYVNSKKNTRQQHKSLAHLITTYLLPSKPNKTSRYCNLHTPIFGWPEENRPSLHCNTGLRTLLSMRINSILSRSAVTSRIQNGRRIDVLPPKKNMAGKIRLNVVCASRDKRFLVGKHP